MYIYTYIYVYVYMCTYCTYPQLCLCMRIRDVWTHMCILHTCSLICMYVRTYLYLYMYIYIHTCIYMYQHTLIQTHVHTCIHSLAHTCARTHTTRTHSHAPTLPSRIHTHNNTLDAYSTNRRGGCGCIWMALWRERALHFPQMRPPPRRHAQIMLAQTHELFPAHTKTHQHMLTPNTNLRVLLGWYGRMKERETERERCGRLGMRGMGGMVKVGGGRGGMWMVVSIC